MFYCFMMSVPSLRCIVRFAIFIEFMCKYRQAKLLRYGFRNIKRVIAAFASKVVGNRGKAMIAKDIRR